MNNVPLVAIIICLRMMSVKMHVIIKTAIFMEDPVLPKITLYMYT